MAQERAVKKRKSLPRVRNLKWKGHKGDLGPKPHVSEAHKALWADPEYREKLLAKRAKSQAKWRGIGRREGIPDGMRKGKAHLLNYFAQQSAKETMAELEKAGVLADDAETAKEALQSAIEVMRKPGSKQVQLQAAKLVLEYTKSKPTAKSEVTVNAAEEWLKQVAKDDKREGEAPSDA